jgi:hypothetical protein
MDRQRADSLGTWLSLVRMRLGRWGCTGFSSSVRGMSRSVACFFHLPWVVWVVALGLVDGGGARRAALW